MKNNLILSGAIAFALGLGSIGAAQAEMIDLYAELVGGEDMADSAAGGEFNGTFDTETRELSWVVSYHDTTGPLIGAHIHGPAQPGENAGIVIGFEGIENNAFSGSEVLEPEIVDDFLAGLYYANLHTDAHPGGEIRGHILPVDTGLMN